MSNEQETNKTEDSAKETNEGPQEIISGDGEFKLTVRKLEMPVRPRGVLAE